MSVAPDGAPYVQDVTVERPCPMSEEELKLHYGDELPDGRRAGWNGCAGGKAG